MLKLRRAVVREAQDTTAATAEQRLVIELAGEPGAARPAIGDVGIVGRAEAGDELIVNVQALDLGLGSGGFDIVHAHLTPGSAFGGEGEAITTAGALHHGLQRMGWDAAVCGPGPGIVGSNSSLGHGGLYALDSAHAALALGCPTVLVARMSSGDERARHRGLSHHTRTVLALLLAPVTVGLPADMDSGQPPGEQDPRLARHDWRPAGVDMSG